MGAAGSVSGIGRSEPGSPYSEAEPRWTRRTPVSANTSPASHPGQSALTARRSSSVPCSIPAALIRAVASLSASSGPQHRCAPLGASGDTVAPAGLTGGVKYWDGQFDDARLAVALARTAAARGALVLNHARVTGLQREAGQVRGVTVRDALGGGEQAVAARCVVNATGIWVDALLDMDRDAAAPHRVPLVAPSQGVHLVVDRAFWPGGHALLVPKTADGRVLFAVPWLGKTILGTTDTPRDAMRARADAAARGGGLHPGRVGALPGARADSAPTCARSGSACGRWCGPRPRGRRHEGDLARAHRARGPQRAWSP